MRRLVDLATAKRPEQAHLSEAERNAINDSRPGVLLASGYIAGGALAGVLIAFSAGVLVDFDRALGDWAAAHNPFFAGPNADLLSLLPFTLLAAYLYRAGQRPGD